MRDWYTQALGRRVAEAEGTELEDILPDLFGYHLLHVGVSGHGFLSASRILHRAIMHLDDSVGADDNVFQGLPEHFPVSPETLDAVVLSHALELADEPHQVLREAERSLVAGGHLVVIGFNPIGLWGLARVLRSRSHMPWCARMIGLRRIKDWFRLLDFEIVGVRQRFYRPPVSRTALLDRLQFMERWGRRWWPIFGGVYVVVGRKRVAALTPIKPRWRPRRSLVSGLADPASRSASGFGLDHGR